MKAPLFLVGETAGGIRLWATVDGQAHHVDCKVGNRRFEAFCGPFSDEVAARAALAAAGAVSIAVEARRSRPGK